jgi:hypothetical protein
MMAALAASPCSARMATSFHLIQIEHVVGGVQGDTAAQAIQLRMRSGGQNHVSGSRLYARDAAGQNPVLLIDFGHDVPNGSLGARVLITTAELALLTDPVAEPDFLMSAPIPPDYLAAGRITLEADDGSEVIWSLAAGGDAYTGPHDGSILNDDDGDFGPAFGGPFPSGTRSLRFIGSASAQSTSNSADYDDVPVVILANNAGEVFTLFESPCYADCSGDEVLDLFDFLCFIGAFNAGEVGYADCDEDLELNLFDFLCYVSAFNQGC